MNGVKYMFEPPAGQGASDDDLIVFLVNYVFAVSAPLFLHSQGYDRGRSAPSGEDEPHTLSPPHPPPVLAVLLNVSIIFPPSTTCFLLLSFIFLSRLLHSLLSYHLTSQLPGVK